MPNLYQAIYKIKVDMTNCIEYKEIPEDLESLNLTFDLSEEKREEVPVFMWISFNGKIPMMREKTAKKTGTKYVVDLNEYKGCNNIRIKLVN